jgi:multidrug efflux pump subunit AcrA (membrane-fusion protein)
MWRGLHVATLGTAATRSPGRRCPAGALALAAALGFPGCTKSAPPPPQAADVQVVEVARQDVPVRSEWVGTTDGYINAQIRAKVQGCLLTKGCREGSTVKAGQLLYQLDPRQYQADLDKAQGDLAQAKAKLARSQLNEAKYRPLVAVGAVSRREYDDTVVPLVIAQGAGAVSRRILGTGVMGGCADYPFDGFPWPD